MPGENRSPTATQGAGEALPSREVRPPASQRAPYEPPRLEKLGTWTALTLGTSFK